MSAIEKIIDFARREAYSDEMEIVDQAAAELAALRDAVATTELESLLLAAQHHMDGSAEDRKFSKKCLDKSLMVVRAALAALEQGK